MDGVEFATFCFVDSGDEDGSVVGGYEVFDVGFGQIFGEVAAIEGAVSGLEVSTKTLQYVGTAAITEGIEGVLFGLVPKGMRYGAASVGIYALKEVAND